MAHKLPKDIFVKENEAGFMLMKSTDLEITGKRDYNILSKSDCGYNAIYTAEEICKRYNSHDDLVSVLQGILKNFELNKIFNQQLNSQEVDAGINIIKSALQKITE